MSLGVRIGNGAGQRLGFDGNATRTVNVADLGGRGYYGGEGLSLGVRIGNGAGQRLGFDGNATRTVNVAGLGGRG